MKIQIKKLLIFTTLLIICISCSGCSTAIDKISDINHQKQEEYKEQKKEGTSKQQTPQNPQPQQKTEETKTVGALIQGTVTKITDGDTIYVSCYGTRVRIIGVNCPEAGTSAGDSATRFTAGIIPVGSTVWLEKDVSENDKYGRPLRYIWIQNPGSKVTYNDVKAKMLNGILVANGHAEPREYPPDTKYATWFHKIQAVSQ